MPDPTKPRPVDALFGNDNAPPLPNYVVEPAQPATTVSPPPVEATPARTPTDVASDERASMPPPPTFETESSPADLFRTSAMLSPTEEDRLIRLSERIDSLYSEVKMDLYDSDIVTEQCFNLLMQARQAVEARDYARAEFYIQSVDAKLSRSQRSIKATQGIGVILLWVWQALAFIAGGSLIVMTYVVNLTLFGLPVTSELIVLLRAVGWGMLGSVTGTLYTLPRSVILREYDSAYAMHYVARPLIGALLGALLFLLSQAGIVAGNLVIGDVKIGPIFLYVFAFLAGFKQEVIGEFLGGVTRRKNEPMSQ
jgi:hypothetical protein